MKGLEVVRETRGKLENNREDDISICATQVETKADKGGTPGLRAHFEKTIAYKSQHADKAAETRRKNEEAAKAAGGQPPPTPGDGQTPPV